MTLTDIPNFRLINQQIAASEYKTAEEIVDWMGAMQAQDYPMSKWAVGIRLPGSTANTIETAFNEGKILRTHLLRPTLHIVSAANIYWLLQLTAPGIKSRLKIRHKELELSESLFKKCNTIIQNALKGANHLNREELFIIFSKAGISTGNQRGYHILARLELDGIVCSGKIKGGKQTYALLNERVQKTKELTREEALEKLARKYFLSHGPATSKDFTWWSGLSVTEARNALEMVKSDLISEITASETYWFSSSLPSTLNDKNSVFLLPAFDEYLISYRDRTASLSLVNNKKAVSDNGIFRPVIVLNGQVIGLWKRTVHREKVVVETDLFQPCDISVINQIEKGAEKFGLFSGKKIEVKHNINRQQFNQTTVQ